VVKLNNSWFPIAIFMALNLAKIFITITITISQYHKNRDIDLKCKPGTQLRIPTNTNRVTDLI
jgi:hypothetical protein